MQIWTYETQCKHALSQLCLCRGQSGPTIRNYNYHSYSPPPVYGGYGPGYGYGGGGITLMPSFGVPVRVSSMHTIHCNLHSCKVQWLMGALCMQIYGGGSFITIAIGLVGPRDSPCIMSISAAPALLFGMSCV